MANALRAQRGLEGGSCWSLRQKSRLPVILERQSRLASLHAESRARGRGLTPAGFLRCVSTSACRVCGCVSVVGVRTGSGALSTGARPSLHGARPLQVRLRRLAVLSVHACSLASSFAASGILLVAFPHPVHGLEPDCPRLERARRLRTRAPAQGTWLRPAPRVSSRGLGGKSSDCAVCARRLAWRYGMHVVPLSYCRADPLAPPSRLCSGMAAPGGVSCTQFSLHSPEHDLDFDPS